MKLRPMTVTDAKRFVAKHHRHNRAPQGGLFAVGVALAGELIGVAIVGRPVARPLDDGSTAEVTRCCTREHKNACSKLYGAALRAAKALGYERAYTYSLQSESGASLKAAGFVEDARLEPRATWSCKARHRVQVDLFGEQTRPPEAKIRWIKIF